MKNHVEEVPKNWRKLLLGTAGIVAFAVPVVAGVLAARLRAQAQADQSPVSSGERPQFDAASIKPNKSGDQGAFMRLQPGGLYRATNAPLRALIASAYMNEFPPKGQLIFGGPGWIDSEHFDIQARAEGNPGHDEMRLMVQSLLEDRFKLIMHHETRQLPIYALVVSKPGKTGPQLHEHSDDAKCTDPAPGLSPPQPGPGQTMPSYCGGFFMVPKAGALRESGNKITMALLGPFLSQSVGRTVVDQTGLIGVFDFTLEFAPELGPGSQSSATTGTSDPSAPPSIFTALQEQLGLKLEPRTGPVDVLVIDHVERPSEN